LPAIKAGHGDVREVPLHAALPWRGFLLDCLLAAVLLIGLTLLLVVPIVMLHAVNPGAAGSGVGPEAAMAAAMPAITVAAIVAMLVTAVLMWWLRGRSLVGPLARMASMPAYGLAVTAGIVIQLGAQSLAWLLAQSGAGIQPSNAQPVTALLVTAPWLAWLLVVVVGPFAEELLMRHVLLRRFAVAGHGGIGLVLTSVVFALLHEPAPTDAGVAAWLGGLAMYAGMGAAFALVYLRTGRFRATFLAHAACNAAALVVAAYSAS
jgi:hypothetical protein